MKKIAGISLLSLTFIFAACSGNENYPKAEDAMDAGREFIRASLDGDMKKANFYLLKDSTNQMIFDKWKYDVYNKLSPEERTNYRQANILTVKIDKVDDSTVNFTYSNTYKSKDTTTVKIVRRDGEWLVDMKEIH